MRYPDGKMTDPLSEFSPFQFQIKETVKNGGALKIREIKHPAPNHHGTSERHSHLRPQHPGAAETRNPRSQHDRNRRSVQPVRVDTRPDTTRVHIRADRTGKRTIPLSPVLGRTTKPEKRRAGCHVRKSPRTLGAR